MSENVIGWIEKGLTLHDLGKIKDALKCFDIALKIGPNYDETWFEKGLVLQVLGRMNRPSECFERAAEIYLTLQGSGLKRIVL